jgi:transcription elongation factor Elf1
MTIKNNTSHSKKKIRKGTKDKSKNFKKQVNLLLCLTQKAVRTIIENDNISFSAKC